MHHTFRWKSKFPSPSSSLLRPAVLVPRVTGPPLPPPRRLCLPRYTHLSWRSRCPLALQLSPALSLSQLHLLQEGEHAGVWAEMSLSTPFPQDYRTQSGAHRHHWMDCWPLPSFVMKHCSLHRHTHSIRLVRVSHTNVHTCIQ